MNTEDIYAIGWACITLMVLAWLAKGCFAEEQATERLKYQQHMIIYTNRTHQ